MPRKVWTEEEQIYRRMSVLERQIADRAGLWRFKSGQWWDEGLSAYVLKCDNCKHLFLGKRADKKTCSETCKKAMNKKQRGDSVKGVNRAQLSLLDLEKLLKQHAPALRAS